MNPQLQGPHAGSGKNEGNDQSTFRLPIRYTRPAIPDLQLCRSLYKLYRFKEAPKLPRLPPEPPETPAGTTHSASYRQQGSTRKKLRMSCSPLTAGQTDSGQGQMRQGHANSSTQRALSLLFL